MTNVQFFIYTHQIISRFTKTEAFGLEFEILKIYSYEHGKQKCSEISRYRSISPWYPGCKGSRWVHVGCIRGSILNVARAPTTPDRQRYKIAKANSKQFYIRRKLFYCISTYTSVRLGVVYELLRARSRSSILFTYVTNIELGIPAAKGRSTSNCRLLGKFGIAGRFKPDMHVKTGDIHLNNSVTCKI